MTLIRTITHVPRGDVGWPRREPAGTPGAHGGQTGKGETPQMLAARLLLARSHTLDTAIREHVNAMSLDAGLVRDCNALRLALREARIGLDPKGTSPVQIDVGGVAFSGLPAHVLAQLELHIERADAQLRGMLDVSQARQLELGRLLQFHDAALSTLSNMQKAFTDGLASVANKM